MARLVFTSMGTVISVLRPGPELPASLERAVREEFTSRDARFSSYRADSELSRVARGDLSSLTAGPEFRATLHRALGWEEATAGAFSVRSPDGILDLAGIVKAEAIEGAGNILKQTGLHDWLLNAGGDVLVGGHNYGAPWKVGIVDPEDRSKVLAGIELLPGQRALATSGVSERGSHIWSASGRTPFSQVSVLAPDIVTADVLATAIMAGGHRTLEAACSRWDIDALCVTVTGELLTTPRLRLQLQVKPTHDGALPTSA
ncbi:MULTISPECIES: FAD:protein FMN transferase [Arthrobacter]|uniref:FAD:protein FMN transferase n=2 Tax=Arthrobacter TaxID=1663 RepID=A0ABU9KGT1_9MICC|nr:FAD:protein FMN transferase [Arthrobacter sp. YJM1]MDP5225972.1 FAD:protein FMN transferase [Arthrobacter sp. YJM1]